jgi:hypothetical protein
MSFEFEGMEVKRVTIEEIVNKPSWDSQDVEFLVEHQDHLDDETLEKLGIVEVKPLSLPEIEALNKKPAQKLATK